MRRNLGRTVQEEIKRIRVAEAKRLLSSTSLPIADIGPRCGFEWGTTLNAVFRRETGMTPRDYRKRCRGRIAKSNG
jgi:transcriptional regulator GlxA family with amidase domain